MKYTDKNTRPQPFACHVENIPPELRGLRQWVLWKYVWPEGAREWAKVPFQVSGEPAKSNDSATWCGFKDAVQGYQQNNRRFDGLGLMCDPASGIVGLDLDGCMVVDVKAGTAVLTPFAQRVVELCDSYTEVSPSGTGLRILVRGEIPQSIKEPDIEIYRDGRYLTMTGIAWGYPCAVREAQSALDKIMNGLQARREQKSRAKASHTSGPVSIPAAALSLSVQERLNRAFASANGPSIRALFQGDITGYQQGDEGQSRADLALCGKLAFWSGGDATMLDQMFRASTLMRPKWDKRHSGDGRTYGEMTIAEAMAACGQFFGQGAVATVTDRAKAQPSTPEQEASRRSAYVLNIGDAADVAIAYRRERLALDNISSGWPEIDELWRPVPRFLTVIIGAKNSGKSSFFDNVSVNLTRAEGWKHAVISFETQPIALHVLGICSLWSGASWSLNRSTHLSEADIKAICAELRDTFIFHALPEQDRSVEGVMAYTEDAVKTYGVRHLLFDPWSELTPPPRYALKVNDFVKEGLTKLRAFTQESDIHTSLIVHPNKARANTTRDAAQILDLDDAADSQQFSNKADYGITIHRPNPGKSDKDYTEIHVTKVRRGLPGRRGRVRMYWQQIDGSYQIARQQSNAPDVMSDPEMEY